MELEGDLVRDVAEIVAGLQVPYSIDSKVLGEAGPAWVRLRQRIGCFGWQDADDIEARVRQGIGELVAKALAAEPVEAVTG